MPDLGAIRGQIIVDTRAAIASYVALRAANAATVFALSRSSAAFLAVGAGLTAAGVAIAAGFVVAVKKAAEFERQMDFFGAVSASTTDQMAAAREEALRLGQDTIYSAGQIADSFVELGKAGVSSQQIIDGVGQAVANLGAAADIPLDKAATIMTAAVQTFELKASDAVHVTDLLAGAANASIVEVEDLGVSLKYVGGVAASLHLPIDDVITGISLLGKYGIRGSTAGTSLRQILVSLSGTSKKASGELKKLGIITKDGTNLFFNAKGQAKPLGEIFQVLQDHTKGLTDAQRVAALKIIFNNRALAAAGVLTREGAKGFAGMNAEISKTTAADVARKRLDNLSGDVEILRGNIETLMIKAGSPFQEFLRGIVQGATKLLQAFADLDAGTQQNILKFIAGIGALLLVMGGISTVIGIVLRFAATMIQLVQAFGFVFRIIRLVILGIRLLSLALLSSPIGWIILAIVALIAVFVLLYQKNETFRNAVQRFFKLFMEGWNQIINFFKGLPAWFSETWNSITQAFTDAWNAIATFFTDTIPNWFTSMVDSITSTITTWWNAFITFWTELPGRVLTFVQMLVDGVVNFFRLLPGRVGYAIGFMIGLILRLWLNWVKFLLTTTVNFITAVVNFFAALPGRIWAFVQAMAQRVIAVWTWLRTTGVQIVQSMITSIINFFVTLPGRVAAFVVNMYNRFVSILTNLWNRANQIAGQIHNAIVNFFQQLPGRVAGFITSMRDRAISIFNGMVGQARTIGNNIVSAIRDTINSLPGLVGGIFDRVVGALKDMAGRALTAAKDFASGLWEGFKDGLGMKSPSFIEKAMWNIVEVVTDETSNLADQVDEIQALGSTLNDVTIAPPADPALVTNLAQSAAASAARDLSAIATMQQGLQDTAASTMAAANARSDLAATATGMTGAAVPAGAAANATKIVSGELKLDESGKAFIQGIAVDVVDNNSQYLASVGRMSG